MSLPGSLPVGPIPSCRESAAISLPNELSKTPAAPVTEIDGELLQDPDRQLFAVYQQSIPNLHPCSQQFRNDACSRLKTRSYDPSRPVDDLTL